MKGLNLSDFFWTERIKEGLNKFDVVGLAGNIRRLPKQTSWIRLDGGKHDSYTNLSGALSHESTFPLNQVIPYGPVGKEYKLLDGVLLATQSDKLIKSGIRFDENFKFHFYDIDFCRQLEVNNLKMGTISLSISHASGGNFKSEAWKSSASQYISKRGE